MKIFNKIVSGIYILVGVCVSLIFLMIWTAGNRYLCLITEYIEKNITLFGVIGAGLILLGIVWIVNWLDYQYKTKVISFDNPDGKIKVSLRAIENYITSILTKQVKNIYFIKVKTSLTSKGLNTKINIKLFSHFNIPELCTHIQEITKNYIQDTVGVEKVANIEIYISVQWI